jgi:hypothetical protein
MIYLAEITAYNLSTSAVETLHFCTGQGYKDLVNGKFYEPAIKQPALMSRNIFNDGKIGGSTTASYGELTLVNSDGGLDYLTGYAFDGRVITLKVGDENAAYSTFTTVLIAGISQAAFEWEQVSIRLRDRITDLQKKKIQSLYYNGTNDNVTYFIDGGADLKDTQKPLIFGRVTNVTPVLINASFLLYQISSGALAEIVNVFDKGTYLARGTDYANSTLLRQSTLASGAFNTCLAEGMIKLGSSPIGTITVTAWEYKTVEQNTVAQNVYRIITGVGGISPSDTVANDYTLLDSQNAANIGLVCTADMMVADVLDQLCESIGAFWGFDNLNRFRVIRLDAPTSTSVVDFDFANIMGEPQLESVNASSSSNVINLDVRNQQNTASSTDAVYKVTLQHDKNSTVQTSDSLAGSVPELRRAYLTKEIRQSIKQNLVVKTAHPSAQELVFSTLLCGLKYAQPEAQRRLTIFDPARIILNISVKIDASNLALLDLNAVVKVTLSRYGLASGKYLRIIGIKTDFENNLVDLKLWG